MARQKRSAGHTSRKASRLRQAVQPRMIGNRGKRYVHVWNANLGWKAPSGPGKNRGRYSDISLTHGSPLKRVEEAPARIGQASATAMAPQAAASRPRRTEACAESSVLARRARHSPRSLSEAAKKANKRGWKKEYCSNMSQPGTAERRWTPAAAARPRPASGSRSAAGRAKTGQANQPEPRPSAARASQSIPA